MEVDDRLQDIPLDLLEALQRDYPTIDVSKEIDRAREWARNHTSPEKPLRNAWRFITAWLRNAVAAAAVVTKGAATATTAPANTCPVPTTSGKERGRRPLLQTCSKTAHRLDDWTSEKKNMTHGKGHRSQTPLKGHVHGHSHRRRRSWWRGRYSLPLNSLKKTHNAGLLSLRAGRRSTAMHSRNDAPHHHNSGDGCGVEGRYVPFSSSGGARPLPYPFGLCGKVRLHHEKKEKVGVAEEATPPPVIAVAPDASHPFPTERQLVEELTQRKRGERRRRRTGGCNGRKSLDILMEVLGDTKAVLSLIQMKGGTGFDVPLGVTPQGRRNIRQLEETLGKEPTRKLIAFAGGARLYIPKVTYLGTDTRSREICLERDRMAKEHPDMSERKLTDILALKYRVTSRHIWRVLKQYYEFVEPDNTDNGGSE